MWEYGFPTTLRQKSSGALPSLLHTKHAWSVCGS